MSEGAKNLKDTVHLYCDIRGNSRIAYAVFDWHGNRFIAKDGTFFPFAVGLKLSEGLRVNQLNGVVHFSPSYNHGDEPLPITRLCFPDPSEHLVRWQPTGMIRQSVYFLLTEIQKRGGGKSVVFEKDWNTAQNHGFSVSENFGPLKPLKRTGLRWLTAWQLPAWERDGLTGQERFERIQSIAVGYGIDPWGSKSSFDDCQAEIKGA